MWEPVGPLPAAVYWRRRCLALFVAVTLAGLVLLTSGPTGGQPGPAVDRTAVTAAADAGGGAPVRGGYVPVGGPATTSPEPAPGMVEPPVSTPPPGADDAHSRPTTPDVSREATASGAPSPPATPVSAAAVPGTGERIRPDDTPRPSVAAPVPLPPGGPVTCTNAMLTAAAELDHAVHRVGSRPVLRLVLTNVSGQPCVRDLDAARQEIVVWSADGTGRLWSSNDCVNSPTIDLRTLVPGRPVAFSVVWGERTTTPGCRQPRTAVPAGTYRLMVRLDDLISPPTPFIRTP